MAFTLPAIHDAIAALIPQREAIVSARRRLTWSDFAERSRRLAHLLTGAGLGCHHERAGLQPWESGQDHLGLYLYNGSEYLEGMGAAFRARVAPFNVNYRYVDDELVYLFRDAQTRAILYHAAFAERLARVLPKLPPMALLLQVEDGSGVPLLPGALDYESALRGASPAPAEPTPDPDDLYIVYTGGTTGMPKGVLWRQEDIFFAALGGQIPGGVPLSSLDELLGRVPYGEMMRILAAPPFMHGAGHWSALMMLHQGGTVVIQQNVQRLDPDDIWRTVERERVFTLSIVGDAFARPLIDQLRSATYDLSSLRVIGSGGAILSAPLKQALLELVPGAIIMDGYGSSETGAQGASAMAAGSAAPASFQLDDHTCLLDETMTRRLERGEDAVGWVARSGRVPLGYLGDADKTNRTYVMLDGVRYSVPGDRARLAADGSVVLLGRDSVCINTGGEKVFAEEVEQVLKKHPAVYDVLVTGTPDERWGQQVTAVVALRPDQSATEMDLRAVVAAELARYKQPRAYVFVEQIVRTPTGKPDYRWAKETAVRALEKGPA